MYQPQHISTSDTLQLLTFLMLVVPLWVCWEKMHVIVPNVLTIASQAACTKGKEHGKGECSCRVTPTLSWSPRDSIPGQIFFKCTLVGISSNTWSYKGWFFYMKYPNAARGHHCFRQIWSHQATATPLTRRPQIGPCVTNALYVSSDIYLFLSCIKYCPFFE